MLSAVTLVFFAIILSDSIPPFEAEGRLNNISEITPYLKENTTLHYYKVQLVNVV
jgi:hypothetical protein